MHRLATADRNRMLAIAVSAALIAAFVAQVLSHARTASATSDEPTHLIAGLRHLQCRSFAPNPEHPPLAKMIAAIPVSDDMRSPGWPCEASYFNGPAMLPAIGGDALASVDGQRLLFRARGAVSIFALLLAITVAVMAREMFGMSAALVSLALLAFEPTVIAHSSLVTTDVPMAATMSFFIYLLYRYTRLPSAARLIAAGLAAGLMLATKHSALVMAPVLASLPLVDAAVRRDRPAMKRSVVAIVVIAIIAVTALWGAYAFRFSALPGPRQAPAPLLPRLAQSHPALAASPAGKAIAVIHDYRLLPESYLQGLVYVMSTSSRSTFILGERRASGTFYYFPFAFLVKTSLALLLLSGLALATRRPFRGRSREVRFLAIPLLAYLMLSMSSRLNIGVRHLLPLYPMVIIFAAAAGAWWMGRHRRVAATIVLVLVLHAALGLRAHPDYIPFSNELSGGTTNTYRVLHDSNADWGQDAGRVGEHARRRSGPCWYAHVGSGALVKLTPCRALPLLGWTATNDVIRPVPEEIAGTFYLSVNAVPPRGDREYEPFRDAQPIGQIGGSTLVYAGRFRVPLLSAVSHADFANWLRRRGDVGGAVAAAQRSVALADDDPRPHLALGMALIAAGQSAQGRHHLTRAEELIRASNQNSAGS